MPNSLVDYAKKYGIFAVLFVSLLIFVLNGYERRETKLINFLEVQSQINARISTTLEKLDIRMCSIEELLKKRN